MKVAGKDRNAPKAATALPFTENELALISEALRIASDTIAENAASLERCWPSSPLIERTRIYAESMADIRQRIEA